MPRLSSLSLVLLCAALTLVPSAAYQQPSTSQISSNNNSNDGATVSSRRVMMQSVAAAATTAFAIGVDPSNAIISSKFCAYGEGDGCADLSEGNPYIEELQRKSAANKETIQRDARNAYYMKNYPDFFAAVGKTMVKKQDGSFVLIDDSELANLKKDNKITVEYATSMGGRVADLTQKPILVFRE